MGHIDFKPQIGEIVDSRVAHDNLLPYDGSTHISSQLGQLQSKYNLPSSSLVNIRNDALRGVGTVNNLGDYALTTMNNSDHINRVVPGVPGYTPISHPSIGWVSSIAYGNGLCIGASNVNDQIFKTTSNPAIASTLTNITSSNNAIFRQPTIKFIGSKFFIKNASNTVISSSDGNSWWTCTGSTGSPINIEVVAYYNSMYFGVVRYSSYNDVCYSTDGRIFYLYASTYGNRYTTYAYNQACHTMVLTINSLQFAVINFAAGTFRTIEFNPIMYLYSSFAIQDNYFIFTPSDNSFNVYYSLDGITWDVCYSEHAVQRVCQYTNTAAYFQTIEHTYTGSITIGYTTLPNIPNKYVRIS